MTMNDMGFVTYMQGAYDPAMAEVGTTPLEFTVPDSGAVLLMAQATALCDDTGDQAHKVGVLFTLYDENDAEVAQQAAYVEGLHPGHATVCLTYFQAERLTGGSTAKVTLARGSDSYGNGRIGEGDYYSISVVELEHSAEIEGHHGAV